MECVINSNCGFETIQWHTQREKKRMENKKSGMTNHKIEAK